MTSINQHISMLTQSLGCSPSVLRNEPARLHNLCNATCVARSRCFEREVLGQSNGFVGGPSLTHTDLERTSGGGWILSPRVNYPSLAAISNLLVIWSSRQQINHRGILLTAMRNVPLKSRAVTLLRGLGSHHVPDHFLLRPRPTKGPSRCLNMPILLVIEDCNNSLKRHIII